MCWFIFLTRTNLKKIKSRFHARQQINFIEIDMHSHSRRKSKSKKIKPHYHPRPQFTSASKKFNHSVKECLKGTFPKNIQIKSRFFAVKLQKPWTQSPLPPPIHLVSQRVNQETTPLISVGVVTICEHCLYPLRFFLLPLLHIIHPEISGTFQLFPHNLYAEQPFKVGLMPKDPKFNVSVSSWNSISDF